MKKFTLFFSILFLFLFTTKSFAADVKLIDNSTLNEKLITVSIDTQEQSTENVKIVLNYSPEVTITKINESELNCSTFSSIYTGNTAEITCTLSSSQNVNGKLAEIIFTSTSEKYAFVVDKTQSQIGELTIDNVVDLGQLNAEGTITDGDTTTGTDENPIETTEGNQPATAPSTISTTQKETTSFMSFLPYILLGAAGIFLIAIIVLLITKKKDDITPNTLQTPAQIPQQPAVPPLINPQPQEVTQTQNESMQGNVSNVETKPTLEQLVTQSPDVSSSTVPMMPTTQTTNTPKEEELSDLEALLVSENPSLNTVPQEPVIEPPAEPNTQPASQTSQNLPPIENTDTNLGYTANISTGGLPEVGSTSPLEPSYQVSPDLGSIEQPIAETAISEAPVPMPEVTPAEMDMNTPVSTPLNNSFAQVNAEPTLTQPTENSTPEIIDTPAEMDMNIPVSTPLNNSFAQVNAEPTLAQPAENSTPEIIDTGLEVDLQSIINQEISSIPLNSTPTNTEPQNPVTPMNPINTTEPTNPVSPI